MAISAKCTCGKSISAKDEYAGRRVKCPACKEPVTLPAAANGKSADSSSAKVTTKCDCGKSFSAKATLAGKIVKCPGCSKPVKIAAAAVAKTNQSSSKPSKGSASDATILAECACGKSIKAPAKYAGKAVKCPACGKPLTIPAATPEPAMAAAGSDIATSDTTMADDDPFGEQRFQGLEGDGVDTEVANMASLLDELGLESSKTGMRCPNCKSDIDEGAVLCVDCGYNIDSGKMVKKSSFVKEKKSSTGVGAPKKKERKGLFGKKK